MVDKKPTSAKEWKGKVQVEGSDLELPSGNVARIKQMSPQAFMSSGVIPDPLTQVIRKAINSKKGMKPSDLKEVSDDPKKMASALEMFDRVLSHVAVLPEVEMPPPCTECGEYFTVDERHSDRKRDDFHKYTEGERDPEVLYADQVDMEDKMFIFNWCMGGTGDLTSFREQLESGVESVSNGEDIQVPAKRTAGRT